MLIITVQLNRSVCLISRDAQTLNTKYDIDSRMLSHWIDIIRNDAVLSMKM